jgi:His/Glu/Gln/Arg/opine family amino acid ABC transporter permease subunit
MLDLSYTWSVLPHLLYGAAISAQFALAAVALSLLLATILTIVRETGVPGSERGIAIYISFIRGTPLLVQIFLVYYALPSIGIDLPPAAAGILALTLNSAAIVTEIMRGGLSSIPKGQIEAATALGLPAATRWRKVILPQVYFKIIPQLVNEFTIMIKATPLLSLITVVELFRTSQLIYAVNFRPVEVLLGAAILYFVINISMSRLGALAEVRLAVRRA